MRCSHTATNSHNGSNATFNRTAAALLVRCAAPFTYTTIAFAGAQAQALPNLYLTLMDWSLMSITFSMAPRPIKYAHSMISMFPIATHSNHNNYSTPWKISNTSTTRRFRTPRSSKSSATLSKKTFIQYNLLRHLHRQPQQPATCAFCRRLRFCHPYRPNPFLRCILTLRYSSISSMTCTTDSRAIRI
jgi:hypothetical protein